MIEVERLTEKDYDEALRALNVSFSFTNSNPDVDAHADFVKKLPIMWTREHDYMSRHLAVREGGKIAALLGVYPLPVSIAGHELLFATIGNVGVLPEFRGKAYMKAIMTAAMEEAARLNIDAARLGGLRSRYSRYGFDHAGTIYNFTLTARNAKEHPASHDWRFEPIDMSRRDVIAFARSLQRKNGIYALRETPMDFFMTLRAWENLPYVAVADGRRAGYLTADLSGKAVSEFSVADGYEPCDMLAGWLENRRLDSLDFSVEPSETAFVRDALNVCERWTLSSPSMFNVMNWDRVAGALLDLRCRMLPLPEGEAVVGIEGWGNLALRVEAGHGSARKTDAPALLTLDHCRAMQFLFGPFDMGAAAPVSAVSPLAAWLPLPLSWNGQDRC